MANRLTSVEFSRIHKKLENHSDTWADLWLLLNLTRARVTQLLQCSFRDIQKDILLLPAYSVFAEKRIPLSPTASDIQMIFIFSRAILRVSEPPPDPLL